MDEDYVEVGETVSISIMDITKAAVSGNLKFGAPVISEFDESMPLINFNDQKEMIFYTKPSGLQKLAFALRLQLSEKNWIMGACDIQSILLTETHAECLREDLTKRLYPFDVYYQSISSLLTF